MNMITSYFGMELKKECLMFKFKGSTYKIPSKIYPLNGRNFSVFSNDNTKDMNNESIKELFNACKFQNGKCYANAEMLKQGAEYLKVEGLKYYSGWIFIGSLPPMNHAWATYNNSVLDGSMLQNMYAIFQDKDRKNFSKQDCAIILKEAINADKPNHEKFCCGKVSNPMIYIGCEDTYTHARELLKKALDITNGKHPSYAYSNKLNPYGDSELQGIMRKID